MEEGTDIPAAPLEQPSPDAAKADAATGALGLGPMTGQATPAEGTVTLATTPPLGSVTIDGVIITEVGTEVDADTAQRAHEAAQRAGFKLRIIT